MDVPNLDLVKLVGRLGRSVTAAAEQTGRVDVETDAYDAVACLLDGTHTVQECLAQRTSLRAIERELLQFAERLQLLLDEPTPEPASGH